MIKKITIIGSGNIATKLSLAFKQSKLNIPQIISRNPKTGLLLAKQTESVFTNNFNNILPTDLIIICINDDHIFSVIKSLPDIAMVHTSGSTDMNVFIDKKNYGVIYPIQSFNTNLDIDFQKIPICIESNNKVLGEKLINLGNKISKKVFYLNSEKRKHIHLAAVIAANFSNFCYLIAKKYLDEQNLDFDLLKPLIIETAKKAVTQNPFLSQTGPAKRGDQKIINQHLEMLNDKNYKKIYKLLSENILMEYGK